MNDSQKTTSGPITSPRAHIALPVRDVDASARFYEVLFELAPVKRRPGYAKFSLASPALNLSLNAVATPRGADDNVRHYGIEVASTEAVVAAHGRMRAAGFATMSEEGVTCCFAVQDKVWIIDPDGHRWEVFVVLEDAEARDAPPAATGRLPVDAGAAEPCCAPATPAGRSADAAQGAPCCV